MASGFPPRDGVPSPQISSNPPNHSFFNEEAIRSGFKVPDESRHADAQRHGVDVTESLEREIIKQRIRAEIMAEELARRRLLEEEIRMELMLEREMAMRRIESTGSRFDSYPGTSQFLHESSSIPHSFGYPEDRRLSLPSTMPVHREVGFQGFQPLPFQRHPLAATPETRKETVVLPKPETNISDLKRKTPISIADHHRAGYTGSEKKRRGFIGLEVNPINNASIEASQVVFRCDICNIQAHNQIALNDHFGGRKHKSKEEALARAARLQVNGESALESGSNLKKDREARLETTPVEKQNKKHKNCEKANSTPNSKAKPLSSNENGKSEQSMPNSKAKASNWNKNGKSEHPAPNSKAKASSLNENGESEQSTPNTKAKALSSNENGKSEQPMANTKAKASSLNENGKSEQPTPNSEAKALNSYKNGKSEQPTPNKEAKASNSNINGKSEQSTPQGNEGTEPVKKLKYWCEMCQAGTHTPGTFADHERGRKHRLNLLRLKGAAGVVQPSVHEVKNLETQMSN